MLSLAKGGFLLESCLRRRHVIIVVATSTIVIVGAVVIVAVTFIVLIFFQTGAKAIDQRSLVAGLRLSSRLKYPLHLLLRQATNVYFTRHN